MSDSELPIIQQCYDLIKWYVPLINRLPREHKYHLGDRMIDGLYDLLERLSAARYHRKKLSHLYTINTKLEILRYQTRLLHDFELIPLKRYAYIEKQLNDIGIALGGWIKQQQGQ